MSRHRPHDVSGRRPGRRPPDTCACRRSRNRPRICRGPGDSRLRSSGGSRCCSRPSLGPHPGRRPTRTIAFRRSRSRSRICRRRLSSSTRRDSSCRNRSCPAPPSCPDAAHRSPRTEARRSKAPVRSARDEQRARSGDRRDEKALQVSIGDHRRVRFCRREPAGSCRVPTSRATHSRVDISKSQIFRSCLTLRPDRPCAEERPRSTRGSRAGGRSR